MYSRHFWEIVNILHIPSLIIFFGASVGYLVSKGKGSEKVSQRFLGLLAVSLVVITLTIYGAMARSAGGLLPKATKAAATKPPARPAEKTRAYELADLLEICDARRPRRVYKVKPATVNTAKILLTVGSADLEDIRKAARILVARARTAEGKSWFTIKAWMQNL